MRKGSPREWTGFSPVPLTTLPKQNVEAFHQGSGTVQTVSIPASQRDDDRRQPPGGGRIVGLVSKGTRFDSVDSDNYRIPADGMTTNDAPLLINDQTGLPKRRGRTTLWSLAPFLSVPDSCQDPSQDLCREP